MKEQRDSRLHAVTVDGRPIELNIHVLDLVRVQQFAGESETVLADRADELVCEFTASGVEVKSIEEVSLVWGNQTFGRNYRITDVDPERNVERVYDVAVQFDEDWTITSTEIYNVVY